MSFKKAPLSHKAQKIIYRCEIAPNKTDTKIKKGIRIKSIASHPGLNVSNTYQNDRMHGDIML